MSKFFRGLGWLIVISASVIGGIILFIAGLATLPFGLILWVLALVGCSGMVAIYSIFLRNLDGSSRASQKIKAMNPHIWDEDGKPRNK